MIILYQLGSFTERLYRADFSIIKIWANLSAIQNLLRFKGI